MIFFSSFSVIIEMRDSIGIRSNMVIPIVTFTVRIILHTVSTFGSFQFFYSEAGKKIYERRIYFFSFKIYYDTIFRNIYRFSNRSDLAIFDGEHSVIDRGLRIYMNPGIFKYGVIRVSNFNTIILREIFLSICGRNAEKQSQDQ